MLTLEMVAGALEQAHWPQSLGSHERALWLANAILTLVQPVLESRLRLARVLASEDAILEEESPAWHDAAEEATRILAEEGE